MSILYSFCTAKILYHASQNHTAQLIISIISMACSRKFMLALSVAIFYNLSYKIQQMPEAVSEAASYRRYAP